MLGIVVGSAVAAAVLGCLALAASRRLRFARDFAVLQLKYNVIAVQGMLQDRLQASTNKTEYPQMAGRVAVVTGGSRGIGSEVVRMLLKCDMEVIIACRRKSAGENAIETIRKSGVLTGKAKVMELDNSSFDSIKKFVEEFKNNYEKLDVLVNNAGIMFTPYRETKDGFEEQYGVNYLSHFLLTMLLMPLLKRGSSSKYSSRIVNVSSCAHLLGDINFEDINHKKNFLSGAAYAQSKLAQLLSTRKLARLFKENDVPVLIHSVHPGVVATDLFDHSYLKYLKGIGRFIFKNPTQGATPIVFAAVDPRLENKSGLYISNCSEAPINPLADDEALQDKLFEFSLKQCGLRNIVL